VAWRSNLKLKLLATYFAQTYVSVIGMLIAPLYVRYLGTEGYGLVGIFTLLQSWMALLDLGFSATLARETARFNAGQGSASDYRHLVSVLSRIFLVSGVAIAVVGVIASPWISHDWLKASAIPQNEVTVAAAVMVIVIALRWRTEPYRSLLVGFERQVLLNVINGTFTTLRYLGALAVLAFVSRSVVAFFLYQLAVVFAETATIVIAAHRLLPKVQPTAEPRKSMWATVRPLLKFSLRIAFTAVLWLAISQYDKLILSSILPLKTYGVFALATVATTGLSLLVSPIGQVLLPRMTGLKAKAEEVEFRRIYRAGTAVIAAIVTPAALLLGLFGNEVMRVWTGNQAIADEAAPILRWYAFGSGLQCFTAFTYFLQYAHGDLKLHVRGNAVFAAVLIPAITVAAYVYGPVGTGVVWFAANLFYVFAWSWVIHAHFAPGLHGSWLGRNILMVGAPAAVILVAARLAPWPWPQSRLEGFAWLAGLALVSVAASGLMIPGVPRMGLQLLRFRRSATS
jgi:O-antigen/teichoic acid export membrane protein